MPRLPPHISRDLDLECLDAQLEHICDTDTRVAKRRRIEKIATLCMEGQPPVIITAALRGPFDKGWRNPWARDHKKKTVSTQIRPQQRKSTVVTSQPPSPETRRGLDDSSVCDDYVSEPEPSLIHYKSDDQHAWLSRISFKDEGLENSTGGNNQPSPSRPQKGLQAVESNGIIRLTSPEVASRPTQSSPGPRQGLLDEVWRSSASASMLISSPTRTSTCTSTNKGRHTKTTYRSTPNDVAHSTSTVIVPRTVNGGQNESLGAQTPWNPVNGTLSGIDTTPTVPATDPKQAMPPPNFTAINTGAHRQVTDRTVTRTISIEDASSDIKEGRAGATALALSAILSRRPSRIDIQQSAENCVKACAGKKRNASGTRGHSLVASPALGSSTGFRYKKAGESRPRSNRARGKSEMVPTSAVIAGEDSSRAFESRSARKDVYEIPTQASLDDSAQESSKMSENSAFSTQAAMLLAHLEFQESSNSTPRASLPSPEETPPEEHVTFTPFSMFNAELDRHSAMQPGQDVPISTQDLFAAASPFAFSTVKKKDSRAIGSSLKFSVYPTEQQEGASSRKSRVQSATPSERMPLKEKNTRVMFSNDEAEKGSQESIRSTRMQLKLPQLDLGKSFGDDGLSNRDLDLTDGYLHNHEVQ
ncbi:unnamed protein product [Periconia digitata]|uniref:Uncharacterized protein n=1 Tax=Periconia digitata TaxID=1303443 RepID=A0A9W4U231_9PLEO|nr:unnamed protein product [Periconia digitata]